MHVVTHMGPSYLIHESNTYLPIYRDNANWSRLLKKPIETLTIRKNPDIIIERVSNFDVLISFDEILFCFHGGQNDPPKMF